MYNFDWRSNGFFQTPKEQEVEKNPNNDEDDFQAPENFSQIGLF